MLLDAAIIIIVISFAVYGFRKGFLFTLIHTVGWAVALVGAFFATHFLSGIISEYTRYDDWLFAAYESRFSSGLENESSAAETLPGTLSSVFNEAIGSATSVVSSAFANMTLVLSTFALLFIIIKLIMWLILRLSARNYAEGFAGFFDGFFGMLLGILKSAIIVFVLLALMLPVSNMVSPELSTSITNQLETSFFAKTLYDNNFVIVLLQNVFGELF